jgi:hypothetical protein
MSGINGLKVTHDPSDRLSWFLAGEISTKRPNYARAQAAMQQLNARHVWSALRPRGECDSRFAKAHDEGYGEYMAHDEEKQCELSKGEEPKPQGEKEEPGPPKG